MEFGNHRKLCCGLLLCHAVDRAETPDKIAAVDSHYFAVGKNIGESVQSNPVIGIIKDRNQDESVGNIEVGVARGQASFFEDDGAGHGQFNDR